MGDAGWSLRNLSKYFENGEGPLVEFKQSKSSSLTKEINAFANTEGGTIYIGVADDNKTIVGCDLTNRERSEIQNIGTACDPHVHMLISPFDYKGKKITAVEVLESLDKPVHCSEGFFLREGANSQKNE